MIEIQFKIAWIQVKIETIKVKIIEFHITFLLKIVYIVYNLGR